MVLHSRELVVRRKGGAKKAAGDWSAAELDDLELVRTRKRDETLNTYQERRKRSFLLFSRRETLDATSQDSP